MPLDHYISQVHLKRFYSPALGKRMYAVRKANLKCFTPNSSAVCRIMDGSTNAYLKGDRAIENFLKTIEPKYNLALEKLIGGRIDHECIYTIAGFVSYVSSCSPTAMRLQSEPLKKEIETISEVLDFRGDLPQPPTVLGGTTFSELLRNGSVKVEIDPKYPQAIGIASILELIALFGNFKWEILQNDFADSPFFTSDFPVAIEQTCHSHIMNKIVPLAPNLAIRIIPHPDFDEDGLDFSFDNFAYRRKKVSRRDIEKLNRLIVRCAEETVFFRENHPWVLPFIAKNQHYRIEPYTQPLKTTHGTYLVSTQRVVDTAAEATSNFVGGMG